MQNLFFRRIELWLVFLLAILAVVGAIGFGAVALDVERGKPRLGPMGRAVHTLANMPETIRILLKRSQAMIVRSPGRFAGGKAGWTFAPGAAPVTGYLLLSRFDGDAMRHVVELVSLADGTVAHRWQPDAMALLKDAARPSHINDLSTLDNARYRAIHPFAFADGSLLIKDHYSYAVKIDTCGQREWIAKDVIVHHSTEADGAGGFWMPGVIEPPSLDVVPPDWHEDSLVRLTADGKVGEVHSLAKILMDHDMDWVLFNFGASGKDPMHLNDIEPVLADGPYWKKGDLFLSLRDPSMIILYRPATDQIVWMKQGPWLAQHDVAILDDHRISVFDNRAFSGLNGSRIDGANSVKIYDFATGAVTGPWDKALADFGHLTITEGRQTILPDGSLLVEETDSGRIAVFGPDGTLRASYLNNAASGTTYQLGWSRWITPELGQSITRAVAAKTCKSQE